MTNTTEDILDDLATIIMDLGAIREQTIDSTDRAALNSQIMALSKWWRKIDHIRASEPDERLADSVSRLDEITKELKKEKKKLQNIAKVIHRAAQAIAIAEKVATLVAA